MEQSIKMPAKHNYTHEQLEYFKLNYGRTTTCNEFAQLFGVSVQTIYRLARKLGVSKERFKTWTKKEDDDIVVMRETMTFEQIAAKTKRTPTAIEWRLWYLGYGKHNRDWFTLADIKSSLGHSGEYFRNQIKYGNLKATLMRQKNNKIDKPGSWWRIERCDLEDWVRRFPVELNGYNVDMVFLVDLLGGIETNIYKKNGQSNL